MNIFICHLPFHYYLFRSIYDNLNDSCFIIPPFSDKLMTVEYGSGMSAKGQYEYVFNLLKTQNIKVADYGERSGRSLNNFLNQNAKNIIVNHWFDGLYNIYDVRIIAIQYSLSGVSANEKYVRRIEFNGLADIILTYGQYSANKYNMIGLSAQPVGNPIFDNWFNNNVNEDDLKLIEKRLDLDKPTILFLPTHSRNSSIDKYLNSLISLSNDYNIIIKLHHLTFNQEANRLCKLLSYNELIVLGDYFDPLPLYKLSDIILSDGSGSFFDALLLEKPAIRLNVTSHDNEIDLLFDQEKSFSNEKSIYTPSANKPEELEGLITNNIGKKSSIDNDLRYSLFFKTDGKAGKRASEIILNNKEYPAIPMSEKYDRALKNAEDENERKYILEKKRIISVNNKPSFSIKLQGVKDTITRYLKRI